MNTPGINEYIKQEMGETLREIPDGRFSRELILGNQANRPVYNAAKRMQSEHQIETVGEKQGK
jgi:ketol-acid reductoisomerase